MQYTFIVTLVLTLIYLPNSAVSQDNCLNDNCNIYIKTKANRVFYIGVNNSIEIIFDGIPKQLVDISSENKNVYLHRKDSTSFSIGATRPIKKTNLILQIGSDQILKTCEIRRVPDPIAKLVFPDYSISYGCGKSRYGVIAVHENFNYETRCNITGFDFTLVTKNNEKLFAHNRGSQWSGKAKMITLKTRSGDKWIVDKIKCKCPGDKYNRSLPYIVREIP